MNLCFVLVSEGTLCGVYNTEGPFATYHNISCSCGKKVIYALPLTGYHVLLCVLW